MEGTITVKSAGDIPTMSEWGLIIMGTLLVGGAAVVIRRRQAALPAA